MPAFDLVLTIAIIFISIALLLFVVVFSRAQDPEKAKSFSMSKDEMKKFVLWYAFYVNPNDPRGTVPKTFGWGWTVNLRTRKNALLFAGLIVIDLLLAVILTISSLSKIPT